MEKQTDRAANPTGTNETRALRAESALAQYQDRDGEANLTDLLTDLRHWSTEKGIDFGRQLERSQMHYEAEMDEAKAQKQETPEQHDVYTRVTNHIIQAIEQGAGAFRMPWHQLSADTLEPLSVASKRPYRGVNVLALWATAQMKGYSEGLWGTYRQWRELGAQVKAGEKATPVVFWKVDEAEDPKGEGQEKEAKKRILARGYSVFNVAQVEGFSLPPVPKLSEAERVFAADKFLFGLGADIRSEGRMACYRASGDYIEMPPYGVFRSTGGFYSTLAHELTHWTGTGERLGRDLNSRFGTRAYAAEELVAELGAAFTMAKLGLSSEPRPDHAVYIGTWLTLLKDDKRAIFTAAAKAQQAVDWLERKHEQLLGLERPGPGRGHEHKSATHEQDVSPELEPEL